MTENTPDRSTIRLSKRIADLGFASRRKAEELIKEGLVRVNGKVVDTILSFVEKTDKVDVIHGKNTSHVINPLREDNIAIYALNKPAGFLVEESSELKTTKRTIYELIPKNVERLIYVGRLDLNSEGLLLLTNNGQFARFLTLPKNKFLRVYRVRAFGMIDPKKIKRMQMGVVIEGVSYKPESIELEKSENIGESSNLWFCVTLRTGKNREIRKMFKFFNLTVNRIIRMSYAGIKLLDVPKGGFYKIDQRKTEKLVKMFRENGSEIL